MTAATEFALGRMRGKARMRILLVEDDPNDAELVQACLEEAARGGAEIVRAASLAEGLRALETLDVSLTVLDLDLPDSLGFETLERVGAAARGPVIVLTGNPHPALVAEALKRRAYEVLRKSELDGRSLARIVRLASLQSQTERSAVLTERRYRALIANFSDVTSRVRESETRFRSLASLSSDWFWEQDEALRFTWYSDSDAVWGGAPVQATLGKHRWEIPGVMPLGGNWDGHKALLAARKPFRDFEYMRTDPNGETHYVSVSGEPVFDGAGRFRGYRGTASDITERKLAELRLERLKTMHAALSAANEAILRAKSPDELYRRACEIAVESGGFMLATVFLLDPATGLLHRAAASGPVTGATESLRPSVSASQPGGQGLIGLACRNLDAVISNDYEADPRAAGRRQARPYRVGAASVFPLLVEGELAGVLGLQHAEKHVFDEELTGLLQRLADNVSFALGNFRREERFRTVVDSANEGILVYDRELNVVSGNAAAERIIGVPLAGLVGKPGFTSLLACLREDGSPLPADERPTRVTTRTGSPLTDYVIGILRPDASVTWLSVNTAFLRRPGETEHYGIVSTIADVTAQRNAELRLRENEERYRAFVAGSHEAILRFDYAERITADMPEQEQVRRILEGGRLAAVNRVGARLYGFPSETEALGKPLVEFGGREAIEPLAREFVRAGYRLESAEWREEIAGEARWFEGTILGTVVDGVLRFSWIVQADITERKRAAQALRESEERFRNLTELSSDWYWEQGPDLRFTRHYGGIFSRIRIAPQSLSGRLRWENPGADPAEPMWVAHREALERRESFRDFEYSVLQENGERLHISVSGYPVFDEDGRFRGYRGIGRDITARKRAEDELRRFRAALDASVDAMFLIDADAMRMIDVNDAAARNLGYERDEMIGQSPALLFAGRSDEDLRAAYQNLAAKEDRTDVYRALYRRKDGTLLPVEITRRLVRIGECRYVVGIARDVTERLRAEERLQQSLERFEIVARATNDVVWDWNLATDQVWWNENFQQVFGYAPYEVGAYIDSWTSRIHPDEAEAVKRDVREAIARGGNSWSGEYRFRRKDGSYASVYDRGLVMRDAAGRPVRMIGAMIDVSERKQAEGRIALQARRNEGLARLGQLALGASDLDTVFAEAVEVLGRGGATGVAVNETLPSGDTLVRAAAGPGAEASVGRSAALPEDSVLRGLRDEHKVLVVDRPYLQARPADRPWAWVRHMGSGVFVPILGENGKFGTLCVYALEEHAFGAEDARFVEAVANVLSSTVRRHQSQTRLAYMAEFDTLTGLPNRNLLQDRLTQTIAQASRRSRPGAVLFIDLDRFKLVNDTLGHHVGDALIAEVGRRLKLCVRAGDTVGRVSGDEFAVVLSDLAQPDDAAIVAQKVLDALARPFDLGGNEAYITASIGISVFPADGSEPETLLKSADMAMYRAKESTRNAYCFFTAQMNRRSVAKLQLNTDLRRAIERREFVLHYQPKVDLANGGILGVEALLRWNHPGRGTVSPAEFIPALEDSGLILPVGEWVLEEAAGQLARWQRDGLAAVPVAVNLSAKQFRRRDLDALIGRTLAAAGVSAGLIELEITESCLMDDPEDAVRLLASLRAAGLRISVDDFGTGYSSLSYLTRLPLNALKIDRSFVRDAASSGEAASIVRAVIDMAHNLNFTVIAEGVETGEQMAFLRRHGCDLGQGYLFAPPMPAADLAARLSAAPSPAGA